MGKPWKPVNKQHPRSPVGSVRYRSSPAPRRGFKRVVGCAAIKIVARNSGMIDSPSPSVVVRSVRCCIVEKSKYARLYIHFVTLSSLIHLARFILRAQKQIKISLNSVINRSAPLRAHAKETARKSARNCLHRAASKNRLRVRFRRNNFRQMRDTCSPLSAFSGRISA